MKELYPHCIIPLGKQFPTCHSLFFYPISYPRNYPFHSIALSSSLYTVFEIFIFASFILLPLECIINTRIYSTNI